MESSSSESDMFEVIDETEFFDQENLSESDDALERDGNRVDNIIERSRRQAERRLISENNPFANLDDITQRLGREASERFRSMLEERKQQAITKLTARVDRQWLRRHYDESEVDMIDDKDVSSVRAITESIGTVGTLVMMKLKNLEKNPLDIEYTELCRNKLFPIQAIVSKLFFEPCEFEGSHLHVIYSKIPKKFCKKFKPECYSAKELDLVLNSTNPYTVVVLVFILCFISEYLKSNDGPYFRKYVTHLKNIIRFYKIAKEQCNEDDKLAKTISKIIIKVLSQMDETEEDKKRAAELMNLLFVGKDPKYALKSLKSEYKYYKNGLKQSRQREPCDPHQSNGDLFWS
ncbi:unnamed protein product [Moneuplotes crassus]|uniref:Uncharacterized protein n=1 Tax=Euplotes crassus TaxID=5936 RepID=A0AAD1U5W5_EUPCR|nr:unnamed protein product [Moneuplotes crassus]